MSAKTVLNTAATVVPIVAAVATGIVAPTILLSFFGAEAGYGALLYTLAFFGGAWGIGPGGIAAIVSVGTAAGGAVYWTTNHMIKDCMSCVDGDQSEVSLGGDHSHTE